MDAKQMAPMAPRLRQLVGQFRCCLQKPTLEHFQRYLMGLTDDLPRKNAESAARVGRQLLAKLLNCRRRTWRELLRRAEYYQWRDALSYASRMKKSMDSTQRCPGP